MTEAISLELPSEVRERLMEISKDCNLKLERACEIILSEFAKVTGGRIYAGRWREGSGLMFVVQWPFLPGLVKVGGEELVKTGVR
mgnify:CR=1 FL=1